MGIVCIAPPMSPPEQHSTNINRLVANNVQVVDPSSRMSNPTPPNPSSNGKQHHVVVPSTSHPPAGIHQSSSFSSYHHHPSAYYYHGHNSYPQQSQLSPMAVQYSTPPPPPPPPSHHPAYSPYHHHPHRHQGQHQHGHHSPVTANSSNTPWPAPPPSSSSYAEGEKMDTSLGGGRGGGHSSPSPSPTGAMGNAPVVADTSALATLADASAASSAGPLKKRRKVDEKKTDDAEERDACADADAGAAAAPRDSESESPASMESSSSPTNINANTNDNNCHNNNETNFSGLAYAQFPSLLHKLLCKGAHDDKGKGDSNKKEDDSGKTALATGSVTSAISSAIEWLPHGRGFRVLRWDTLCTEVLPKDFSHLCDGIVPLNDHADTPRQEDDAVDDRDDKNDPATPEENTEKEPSDEQWIEAFLWHTKAWGFEEVTSGVDRGSFRHRLFVRESPERCSKMHRRRSGMDGRDTVATPLALTPYGAEIGHTSSFDVEHNNVTAAQPSWSKSHNVVSSIFKPRRRDSSFPHSAPQHYNHHQQPSHLRVPVLGSSATVSFADATSWGCGGEHNHHRRPRGGSGDYQSGNYPHARQYPHQHSGFPTPHPNTSMTRSPKTIRFREDPPEESPSHHREDIAVEIAANPAEASPPILLTKKVAPPGFHRGFVSRRGRRPALISRHATH